MSVALKEIRHRIRSIRQISKVTNALQSVSAARLDLYGRLERNVRHYTEMLGRTVLQADLAAPERGHPFMAAPKKGRTTLVVFGTDRGLCGSFNSDLMRAARRFLQDYTRNEVDIIVMGKIVNRRLRRRGYDVQRLFNQPGFRVREDNIRAIYTLATEPFLQGKVREVYILYTQVLSPVTWKPVIERLLPVDIRALSLCQGAKHDQPATTARSAGCFEPNPAAIVEALLPEFIYRYLELVFLDSLDAETVARQRAMARASENARNVLDELVLTHNRLRQEHITTEMIELAGGGTE